jgi:phospholipase C
MPNLEKIQRFVVLMLENRSFDHLVGYLKTVNPNIEGVTGTGAT